MTTEEPLHGWISKSKAQAAPPSFVKTTPHDRRPESSMTAGPRGGSPSSGDGRRPPALVLGQLSPAACVRARFWSLPSFPRFPSLLQTPREVFNPPSGVPRPPAQLPVLRLWSGYQGRPCVPGALAASPCLVGPASHTLHTECLPSVLFLECLVLASSPCSPPLVFSQVFTCRSLVRPSG